MAPGGDLSAPEQCIQQWECRAGSRRPARWLSSVSRLHRRLCISRVLMPAWQIEASASQLATQVLVAVLPPAAAGVAVKTLTRCLEARCFLRPVVRTGGASACPGRQQLFVFAARKALVHALAAPGRGLSWLRRRRAVGGLGMQMRRRSGQQGREKHRAQASSEGFHCEFSAAAGGRTAART